MKRTLGVVTVGVCIVMFTGLSLVRCGDRSSENREEQTASYEPSASDSKADVIQGPTDPVRSSSQPGYDHQTAEPVVSDYQTDAVRNTERDSSKLVAAVAEKESATRTMNMAYAICLPCHGVDGTGQFPTFKIAPSLVGSKFVLGNPEAMALAILKGIEKDPTDKSFVGVKTPMESALNDKQLAAAMSYIRNAFGNQATAVTESQVRDYREKFADIDHPVKRSTLEELLGNELPAPQ